jgi:phosphate transport system ATP-binding protein
MTETTLSANGQYAVETREMSIYYGDFRAVKNINLKINPRQITALIGPSGCGKSTVLRAFNRMNDLVPTSWLEGEVFFHGKNLYDNDVDPVEVRRRVGMVFQKPNPFPKSIYENVAWGAKINGYKGDMDTLVEQSLRQAAIWDEVKDKLDQSGYHGRTGLGPRSHLYLTHRRAYSGFEEELHHHHRDPQYAASCSSFRLHSLFQHG